MSYVNYNTVEPRLDYREEFKNSTGSFSAKWMSPSSLPQPRDASSDAEYDAYTDFMSVMKPRLSGSTRLNIRQQHLGNKTSSVEFLLKTID